MKQETYIYRLPSGDASLIEPLASSGFFEMSAPSFSKNHLLKALAGALTLLHNQSKPVLESQQQECYSMTNLTLDLAKTIVYSALSSDDAVAKLQQAGFDVKKPHGNTFINVVDFGGPDFIAFSPVYLSENQINVTVCGEFVTPAERKAFLESQQQPTDTVPALSTVADAQSPFVVDETDFLNLIGLCIVLGGVAQRDEDWQRLFFKNFLSLFTLEKHIFEAKLIDLLDAHIATSDHYAAYGDEGPY